MSSNAVYKGIVNNPFQIKINSQLNANASTIKIDLRFLEAPQPSSDNYKNVQQNSPEWPEIKRKMITVNRLPTLLNFMAK